MTIQIDVFTLAGLIAVIAAYPPVFRQIRDVVTTTITIAKVMKRYVDLPATVHRVELLLNEHETEPGLHLQPDDHGGTT